MSVLITGCNRGLGLALAKHISTVPTIHTIIATGRSQTPSNPLAAAISTSNNKITYTVLDVDSESSITSAISQIQSHLPSGLDVLINNAGIQFAEPGGICNMTRLSTVLHTNVVSVHNLSTALLPLLRQGTQKKIINVTSTLGSISLAPQFGFLDLYSYKISKAALNMLTAQYALDLGREGFTCLAVSPGNLRTDLGGHGADLDVGVGADAVWKIVESARVEDNGRFRNISVEGWEIYDGKDVAW